MCLPVAVAQFHGIMGSSYSEAIQSVGHEAIALVIVVFTRVIAPNMTNLCNSFVLVLTG